MEQGRGHIDKHRASGIERKQVDYENHSSDNIWTAHADIMDMDDLNFKQGRLRRTQNRFQ